MKPVRPSCLGSRALDLALPLLICLPLVALSTEWPHYRGPTRDGISTDRLNKQWSGTVTNPLWRVPVTNCLGSLTVSGGRVFTQTRRMVAGQDSEVCVALNASNGVELWATPVGIALYPGGGVGFDDGPRTTPVVDGDSVYVLSSYFNLHRLNATNGARIWTRDLMSLYGSVEIGYENAASPVMEDGLIFLNANCHVSTLMAFRATDGSVAWRSQNEWLTHSTPTLATIQGVRQVIFATGSGLVSLDPLTGTLLWRTVYPFIYAGWLGVSPVVHRDMVFICGAHSYGMGSGCFRVSLSNATWSTTRLWSTNNPSSHWMTPVARDGFLYGQFGIQQFDSPNAQLKCIEMRTGAVKWSINGFGRCATILMDDHLISLTELGQLVLVKPLTNAYTELARFTAIPDYNGDNNKCWNGPAVSEGRVFVRSTAWVAAFDLSLPALQMDAPRLDTPGAIDLSIRTVTGAPVASNRLTGIEVRASTNLSLALTQWNRLTNSLVLTSGVVRVQHIATGAETQRFFIATEPQ